MLYQSNLSYFYSWYPISFPFNVDGVKESHTPVFLLRQRQRSFISESLCAVADKYSSTSRTLCGRIYALTLVGICVWSPEKNLKHPRKAVSRFPRTTHGVVQFLSAIRVRYAILSLANFTGNPVVFWWDM